MPRSYEESLKIECAIQVLACAHVLVSRTHAVVTVLAGGQGGTNMGYSDATGTQASFAAPWSVAAAGACGGHVVVADQENHRIRQVTLSGGTLTHG